MVKILTIVVLLLPLIESIVKKRVVDRWNGHRPQPHRQCRFGITKIDSSSSEVNGTFKSDNPTDWQMAFPPFYELVHWHTHGLK